MTLVLGIVGLVAIASIVDTILTRGPAGIRRRFDAWTDRFAGGPPRLDLPAISNVRKIER